MAGGRDIKAGRAYVALGTENGPFRRGLRLAERQLKAFGARVRRIGMGLGAAGGAILAPLAGATKLFASMGDDLQKMSARTGVGVRALSELAHAATRSGTETEMLEKGLRRMQRSIYDAGRGLSTANDALAAMGLTMADLEGRSPEQQFMAIARGLNSIEDASTRAGVAQSFLGRSGTYLLPLIADVEALRQEARDLGLGIDPEDADRAAALTDALSDLWAVAKRAVFAVGSALGDELTAVISRVTDVAVRISEWVKANKHLVLTVAAVGVGLAAAGAAFIALGAAISGLGTVLGLVASALGVAGSALAALLSPIGLVIAGVAGLGGYIAYATGAAGEALAWLQDRFADLSDFAGEALSAIKGAMRAGDWELVGRILWLTLKVAWQTGVNWLMRIWRDFGTDMLKAGTDAFYGLKAAWVKVASWFKREWTKFSSDMQTIFTALAGTVRVRMEQARGRVVAAHLDMQYKTGELTRAEYKRASEQARREYVARLRAVTETVDARLEGIESERQARIETIDSEKEAELAAIGKAAAERRRQIDADAKARVEASRKALEDVKRQWREAVDEGQALEPPEGGEPPGGPAGPREYLGDLTSTLADVDVALRRAASLTVGTFSPFFANVLGGRGSAAERTARAAEETAENTAETRRQLARGIPVRMTCTP